MGFTLTETQVASFVKRDEGQWHKAMVKILPKYKIDTGERVAAFIAQCAHESADFSALEENLNYSEAALKAVFGKYFRDRSAAGYARKPENIANLVYANRMGNGSTKSGEGWKFRGRGVIQLTGKDNYLRFGEAVGLGDDEDAIIRYLTTFEGALESACWFWDTNNLNDYADKGDLKGMTKRINGGYNGLEDREKHYKHALEVLGVKKAAPKPAPKPAPEKKEAPAPAKPATKKTPTTKDIQAKLGLTADGIKGPKTIAAIKAFQTENGLVADGIAGPKTLKVLFGG